MVFVTIYKPFIYDSWTELSGGVQHMSESLTSKCFKFWDLDTVHDRENIAIFISLSKNPVQYE